MIPREGCAVVAVAAVTACSPVRRLETPEWAPKGEQSSVSSSVALPEGLRFEANLGQFDPRVQYIARVHGGALVLDDQGATLAVGAGRANVVGVPARWELVGRRRGVMWTPRRARDAWIAQERLDFLPCAKKASTRRKPCDATQAET